MVDSLFKSSTCFCLITYATLGAAVADDFKTASQSVVRNENATPPSVPAGDGWTALFSGKDLTGWTQRNGWAVYRIEGDSILGTTAKDSPNSFLCTDKDYSDFELKFEVQVDPKLNSGVQIRSKSLPEKDKGRVHGPQVEIMRGPGESGYIYGEATGRNWISPSQPAHEHHKNGQWNQYYIRAVGTRIQTWINGKLIEDITDPQSFLSGFIGLQVHGIAKTEGPFQVKWRKIEIRDLSKK
ncbi:MAG TPA: DUF1080 domain-containing protein [Pirellula sp.]|nr:DUF1080 domain-containing protein [Pirellula sp.]